MGMNIFRSMDISASALTAQRFRMDIIGENIANATTTHTEKGEPYRRKFVLFQEKGHQTSFSEHLKSSLRSAGGGGVRAVSVEEDSLTPFKLVYDPEHPDADEKGYVSYPNVDMEREMVDMISATRAYEANITAINNFKNIAMKAMEIGR